MKKITLVFLLLILANSTVYAAKSDDDQLKCIAKKVIEDCKDGILLGECEKYEESTGTAVKQWLNDRMYVGASCMKTLESDTASIVDQLKKYEDENFNFGSLSITHLPVVACKMEREDIFLENDGTQHMWGGTRITCPTEENNYAETHGSNSPAIAGDDNKIGDNITMTRVTWGGGGFLLGIFGQVIASAIWDKMKKRRK